MRVEAKLARDDAARNHDVMTGQFQPINDDHAIEQVTFTIGFARPFTEADLAVFRKRHDLWADTLPAMRDPAVFAVQIEDGSAVRVEKAPGVEFAFMRPDGSPVWAMRVLGPEIVVECTRYSRWARVWGAAQRYFGLALDLVSEGEGEPNAMLRTSLVVQDAFKAPADGADLRSLFVNTDLLPEAMFGRGSDWHVNTGWFSDLETLRVLHNLNIDGAGDVASNIARVRIQHVMTVIRGPADVNETASERRDWLGKAMDALHLENKALVGRLLQPALLNRIGMPELS